MVHMHATPAPSPCVGTSFKHGLLDLKTLFGKPEVVWKRVEPGLECNDNIRWVFFLTLKVGSTVHELLEHAQLRLMQFVGPYSFLGLVTSIYIKLT